MIGLHRRMAVKAVFLALSLALALTSASQAKSVSNIGYDSGLKMCGLVSASGGGFGCDTRCGATKCSVDCDSEKKTCTLTINLVAGTVSTTIVPNQAFDVAKQHGNRDDTGKGHTGRVGIGAVLR